MVATIKFSHPFQ